MSKQFKDNYGENKSSVANETTSNSMSESSLQEIIIPNSSNVDHNLYYQDDALVDHSENENINNRNEISSELTTLELSEVDIGIPQDLPVGSTNSFAINKGIAEGMMDIALLTANANQLRFLITYNKNANTYTLLVTLIVTSLIIQIAVGVALIFKHRMKDRGEPNNNSKTNDFIVSGIFLVTVINVFAAAFTTTETNIGNATVAKSISSSLSTLSN